MAQTSVWWLIWTTEVAPPWPAVPDVDGTGRVRLGRLSDWVWEEVPQFGTLGVVELEAGDWNAGHGIILTITTVINVFDVLTFLLGILVFQEFSRYSRGYWVKLIPNRNNKHYMNKTFINRPFFLPGCVSVENLRKKGFCSQNDQNLNQTHLKSAELSLLIMQWIFTYRVSKKNSDVGSRVILGP